MKQLAGFPCGQQDAVGHSEFTDPTFSRDVIAWQQVHGRHTLPWQNTRDAYRVWLSEIMLQQTQVAAVIPYYQRFLLRFPDVATLATAPSEAVMAHWSGLGYYARARNLHLCAKRVMAEYGGVFPSDPQRLAELPGIGRSTAAAIAAFAYARRAAILDGNVKRVFARLFGVETYPGIKQVENELWKRAEALLPAQDIAPYTQGLMDLGATLCTRSRPACLHCPLAGRCVAFATGRVHDLPIKKPIKVLPEKRKALLVISDRSQVLLQQRPDSGIWGGLLSLPEMDAPPFSAPVDGIEVSQSHIVDFSRVVAPFGEIATCLRLPSFIHVFTHFKLQIEPYHITLLRRHEMAGQLQHKWYGVDQLAQAPLPAPVKKMLRALFTRT